MEYQIRCKVFPGQFSSEYAVEGTQANGDRFSLFAPARLVETDEPVTRDRAVDGWLKVSVWQVVGDRVIVQLPRESFESGRFVTVNLSQFKDRPEPGEPGASATGGITPAWLFRSLTTTFTVLLRCHNWLQGNISTASFPEWNLCEEC